MKRDIVCIPWGREEHMREGAGVCLFLEQGCTTKCLTWFVNLGLPLFQNARVGKLNFDYLKRPARITHTRRVRC